MSSCRRDKSPRRGNWTLTLTVLEVVEEDMKSLRLDTVVLDDDARAANDLAGVALTVDLAETGPGTKDLGVTDLDEVDLVLGTESLNELDVLGLSAGLDENAEVGLTLVECLGALSETASKAVMDECVLQDLLHIQRSSVHVCDTAFCNAPEAHPRQTSCPWEPR